MRRLTARGGSANAGAGAGAGDNRSRRPAAAALAALLLGSLTLSLVTGCAAGGEGVRVEGAPTEFAAPEPSGAADADAAPGSGHDGPSSGAASASAAPDTDGDADGDRDGAGAPEDSGTDPGAGYMENDGTRDISETTVIAALKRDPKVGTHVKRDLVSCGGGKYPVGVAYGRLTSGPQEDLIVNVSSCADSVGVGTYVYQRSTSGTLVNVFADERPPVSAAVAEKGILVVTRDIYIGDEPMCCPSGRDIITYQWQDGVFKEFARKRTHSQATPSAPPAPAPAPEKD